MKAFGVVMILLLAQHGFAAFEPAARGARTAAMGGASVAEASNAWAAFSNPAGLSTIGTQMLSLSYIPGLFGIGEISSAAMAFVQPVGFGSFALSGSRFGFELYREIEVRAGFGKPITDDVHLGVSLTCYSLAIERYGSDWTLGADVGILVALSDQVRFGFSAINVNSPSIGREKERLPQVFAAGINYRPLQEVTLVADLVKDIRHDVELQAGVEYAVFGIIDLRGGTSNNPSMIHAGVGIRHEFLGFDYTYRSHADLGSSHILSLTIRIGEM